MTDKEQPSVEVTQADRLRALNTHLKLNPGIPERWRSQMFEGELDGDRLVQAFARHRTQSTAELRAQLAESEAENTKLRAERDALSAERGTFMHNKRINDAMQTAVERGEIWCSLEGYWKARNQLTGAPK